MMMMMINKCCQDIFTAAGRTMSPLHAVSLIPNVGEKKVTNCSIPIPILSAVTIRSQQLLALVNAYRFGAQLLQVRGLGEIEDNGVLVSLELDVTLRSVLPE